MSDLIRREDVFKAILDITAYDTVDDVEIHCDASVADSEGWLGGVRDALRTVEYIQSAKPERKKGHWKHVALFTRECSECRAQFHDLEYDNFCPNCGARLE